MSFGVLSDCRFIPQHRIILNICPLRNHIIIVLVERVTGLASRVHRDRIAEIRQIVDGAHGWDIRRFVAFCGIP